MPSRARPRAALVALALGSALSACAPSRDPGVIDARYFGTVKPPRADVLRFNNGAEPETFDPGLLSGQPDGIVARILFEGLTSPDPQTLQPLPGQAKRWEVSADGLTLTFHLRPRLAWSDGSALTATDFVYAWRRVLDPASGSRSASLLFPLAGAEAFHAGTITDPARIGVRAEDDSTLVVTLARPTAYFLFLTSYPTLFPVPRQCVERWGARWTEPGRIAVNGPFVISRHRRGDRIEFTRNARYWDAAGVGLDGIVAYSVDDLNTSTNLYKAGELDWNPSGYIPSPFLPHMRRFADYSSGQFQATYFYSVNTTRRPFGDPRVRRALSMAIDREAIANDLLGGTRRAWGRIVPSGYPGYRPPPEMRFDPDSARHELARAGFPGGRGFPRFTILFSTSEDHRRIAEAVQAMWRRELNVPVELENQEFGSTMDAMRSLRYDVARRSWIGDYLDPNTFLEPLRTGDGNNRTGWGDPRFDALVRRAATELDPERRMTMLGEAESLALEASAFLPILHYATHELVKPYVRGLHPTVLDVHPLTRVWFDRDWRQHVPIAARRR